MGMSKSILSRRVARLEEQLGAKLLTRTAQGAHPTDIGDAYFARASNILADLDAAREVVADAVTPVAGSIRLATPLSFGTENLGPAIADLARIHPKVSHDISPDARRDHRVGGGCNCARRTGPPSG